MESKTFGLVVGIKLILGNIAGWFKDIRIL
jgi:hypothetical protein